MKIKLLNTYHKRLSFDEESFAFSIDTNEIKAIDIDIAEIVLKNMWIKEIKQIKKKKRSTKLRNKN